MANGKPKRASAEEIKAFWESAWYKDERAGSTTVPNIAFDLLRVDSQSVKEVLNVGCGALEHYNFDFNGLGRITGVDISPTALELAKDHHSWSIERFKLVEADALNLPFPDGMFDMVTAFELMHLMGQDWQRLLKELHRVSKDYVLFNAEHEAMALLCFEAPKYLIETCVLNEVEIGSELARLSFKETEMQVLTVNEFYNYGIPIYKWEDYTHGEDSSVIFVMARK